MGGTMTELKWHPAANIFPMLEDKELQELAEDIRKNGQHEPISICDGMILDGRNRSAACLIASVEPVTIEVDPEDPVAYVLSLNLHRRHLTPSQGSMCAGRARAYYDEQAKERQQVRKGEQPGTSPVNLPDLKKSDARDAAGKAFGVSGKSVDYATKVIEKGIPELAAACLGIQAEWSAEERLKRLRCDLRPQVMTADGRWQTNLLIS